MSTEHTAPFECCCHGLDRVQDLMDAGLSQPLASLLVWAPEVLVQRAAAEVAAVVEFTTAWADVRRAIDRLAPPVEAGAAA